MSLLPVNSHLISGKLVNMEEVSGLKIGVTFSGTFEYSNIKPTKLQLPSEFWELKGFCGYFLLSVPKVSTNWMVKIEFVGQKLVMTEGFADFCNFFNVVRGSQIQMEYTGKRTFLARLENYDGVEIEYQKYATKPPVTKKTNDLGNSKCGLSICVLNNYNKSSISIRPNSEHIDEKLNGSQVRLKLSDHCVWSVSYDRRFGRLMDVEEFLTCLNLKWYNPLIFRYVENDCFDVKVYRSCAVEDQKLLEVVKSFGNSNSENVEKSAKEMESEYTLKQKLIYKNKELALLKVNAYAYPIDPIFLAVEAKHVNNTSDYMILDHKVFVNVKNLCADNKLWFILGQLEFCLQFSRDEEKLCVRKGWKKFIKDSGLKIGDVLIIQPLSNIMKMQICIWTFEDSKIVNKDLGYAAENVSFVSIVNSHTLQHGIIRVPFPLKKIFDNLPKGNITCCLNNGSLVDICYSYEKSLLSGLKGPLEHVGVVEDCLIVVSPKKSSPWKLELFNRNGLEIEVSEPFTAEIQDGCKSQKIVETTHSLRYGVDESHDIGTEEAIVERNKRRKIMEEMTNNNTAEKLLTGANKVEADRIEHDIPGGSFTGFSIYEAVMKSSHVDNQTRGVYLSKDLLHIYKRWRNKSVAKVKLGNTYWEISMNITKSCCRFGKGWNEFVSGNGIKEGDVMRYALVEPNEKVFVAEIIEFRG